MRTSSCPPSQVSPLRLPIVVLALAAALTHRSPAHRGPCVQSATGDFLEGVRISVEGTALETASDSDGNYRLTNVPPGTARVRAFYTGFPVQTGTVEVAAGRTAAHEIRFSAPAAQPTPDGTVVKLGEFVVSTSREMSGAALAINEQRFAANMKNVVAVDEFGDVAESNVAEFLKFLPGVNIDYAGGNARDVRQRRPGDYVPVTIAGFSLASAVGGGGGGTNRAIGLDQVSINNLSRIEVEYCPPRIRGQRPRGSVNMIPRSSFSSVARPVFNFSTYFMMCDNARTEPHPAPRHPTRKIIPAPISTSPRSAKIRFHPVRRLQPPVLRRTPGPAHLARRPGRHQRQRLP